MTAILFVVAMAAVGLVAYQLVTHWGDEGSVVDRIWAAFRESHTLVVTAVTMILPGGLTGLVQMGSEILGMPEVSNAIRSALDPKYLWLYLVTAGVLTHFARLRPGSKDPL